MKGKFEQHSKRGSFFYIGSVLKRFLCGMNILAFLYMAINYGITFLFFYAMAWSVKDGLIGASFFMFISLFVALTPIGEGILRMVHGLNACMIPTKKKDFFNDFEFVNAVMIMTHHTVEGTVFYSGIQTDMWLTYIYPNFAIDAEGNIVYDADTIGSFKHSYTGSAEATLETQKLEYRDVIFTQIEVE